MNPPSSDARGRQVELSACAKVNFGLRITGRRDDGYHLLDSLFVPLTLADRVALKVWDDADRAPHVTLSLSGEQSRGVPADADNLAQRAAEKFLAAAGESASVEVELEKQIPAAAGLGGGSSDAAAVLRGLSELYPEALPVERLSALALELGADVPFFLDPQPARVTGVGEQIAPQPDLPACVVVLANSGDSLSTAAVYDGYDERRSTLTPAPPGSTMPAFSGSPKDFVARLGRVIETRVPDEQLFENDLEPAASALCPAISNLRGQLVSAGALATGMSGSGATVFALFSEERTASEACEQLRRPKGAAPAWVRVANTLASR